MIKASGGSWQHCQSLNFSEELKPVGLSRHDEILLQGCVEKLIFNFLVSVQLECYHFTPWANFSLQV